MNYRHLQQLHKRGDSYSHQFPIFHSGIKMRSCSITRKLQIVPGCPDDYKELAHYHYRDSHPGPFAAIFALKPTRALRSSIGTKTIGVIVYSMPIPGLELRNIATDNLFAGFDRTTQLALINKNIRCISRVVIEPRFRSGDDICTKLVFELRSPVFFDSPFIYRRGCLSL